MGHLAVSSIYGMLYAVSSHLTGLDRISWLPGWLAGLIYAMWAVDIGCSGSSSGSAVNVPFHTMGGIFQRPYRLWFGVRLQDETLITYRDRHDINRFAKNDFSGDKHTGDVKEIINFRATWAVTMNCLIVYYFYNNYQ